jgi:hypothetical protein
VAQQHPQAGGFISLLEAGREGLLPFAQAQALFGGAYSYHHGKTSTCQMLLRMDALLSMFFPNGRLPFTDLPSPEVYRYIFSQLWGDDGGGVLEF